MEPQLLHSNDTDRPTDRNRQTDIFFIYKFEKTCGLCQMTLLLLGWWSVQRANTDCSAAQATHLVVAKLSGGVQGAAPQVV